MTTRKKKETNRKVQSTILMNESIDGQTEVLREINQYQKMLTRKLLCILIISILCIIGIVTFYELKINALVGAAYLKSPELADSVTYVLFRRLITARNLSAVTPAMKACGYTENGAWYLFQNSGQFFMLLIILLIVGAMAFVGFHEIVKIAHNDIFRRMNRVIDVNVSLNQKLSAKNNLLEKQKVEMQQFIENIAHQIKTPLAGLSLMLDRMEPKSIADQAYEQVKRVSEFVYRLLNISRMESGKVHFNYVHMNLKSMIQDAVAAAGLGQLQCRIRLECEDSLEVVADEKWMTECLINLVSNCIDSVQDMEHGKVWIHAINKGEKCIITISDNGKGFQGKDRNAIFDRYETDRNSEEFHVGIGLNLSKLIVLAHHGTITASDSQEYGGAEFRISLPQYHLKEKHIM